MFLNVGSIYIWYDERHYETHHEQHTQALVHLAAASAVTVVNLVRYNSAGCLYTETMKANYRDLGARWLTKIQTIHKSPEARQQ